MRNQQGTVMTICLVMFAGIFLMGLAVSGDFHRMRLHRHELQQAADAAALAAPAGAWIDERVDGRGKVWRQEVRWDQAALRREALDVFRANMGTSRAGKMLRTIRADAWVDPDNPDTVVVTAQGRGDLPFAALIGKKELGLFVKARAQAIIE